MAINLDRLEEEAQPKVERTLRYLMNEAISNYAKTGVAGLPNDANTRVQDMLKSIYTASIKAGGMDVVDGLKECFLHLETKQTIDEQFSVFVNLFIDLYGAAKVQLITNTTRQQIQRVISMADDEGIGTAAITKRLRDAVPQFSKVRAAVIARTESHAASQYGSISMAKQSTRPLVKGWSSIEDDRTRSFIEGDNYDHLVMNGETVALEQSFNVPTTLGGTEPLQFPGDPNGSAGNVINCRCAMTYRRADRDN